MSLQSLQHLQCEHLQSISALLRQVQGILFCWEMQQDHRALSHHSHAHVAISCCATATTDIAWIYSIKVVGAVVREDDHLGCSTPM